MPKESDHFSIRDAIADIFRGYGAYVAPSITDPVYLRVILDDIKVAVGYWISSTPPGPNDIIRFLDNTDDTFYHHFAFLTNHEFSEDLVESARENDVVLLGRDDLETELGKTHLKLLERIHDSQVTSIDDVVDDHPLVRRLLADQMSMKQGVKTHLRRNPILSGCSRSTVKRILPRSNSDRITRDHHSHGVVSRMRTR